jgi:hypothetical protein
MGSEKYPYKGIIDHLANRGFSHGTNAWTDTDHTGKSFPQRHIPSFHRPYAPSVYCLNCWRAGLPSAFTDIRGSYPLSYDDQGSFLDRGRQFLKAVVPGYTDTRLGSPHQCKG